MSEEFGDDVDIVLIDKADGFVFGFSKLDVMFDKAFAANVATDEQCGGFVLVGGFRACARARTPPTAANPRTIYAG